LVDTCWLFSTADCAGHDLSAWMRAIPGSHHARPNFALDSSVALT
jgi:hypothetical protein